MLCLVVQLCPTVCDPMDYSPPDSSVCGNSPGQNIGVGFHALFQRIFPTQGSNSGLPHCRWILYCLSHQGNQRILEWAACPSSGEPPDPGIQPGPPALQVDSSPASNQGSPYICVCQARIPTPVFLSGEFHGQRSLVGYSPWGHKESDMTEQITHTHTHTHTCVHNTSIRTYICMYIYTLCIMYT